MKEDTIDNPQLSDRTKRLLLMAADALVLPVALWAAVALRYGDIYIDMMVFWWHFPIVAVVGVLIFKKFDLYRAIVRYIGPSSMLPVIQGVTGSAIAVSLASYLTGTVTFPRSAPIIFWFVAILMIGGGRIVVRAYFYGLFKNYLQREKVAIYGANESGAQLAIALLNGNQYMPVAFFDDDRMQRRNTIHGIRVYDGFNVNRLIDELGIRRILLAVPEKSASAKRELLNRLAEAPVHINIVPDINRLVIEDHQPEIVDIDIGDLLGRTPVPPDRALMSQAITGKTILVTGAAGTIGSELCRKILHYQPNKLVLFDNSEFGLYSIEQELMSSVPDGDVVFVLGSILNAQHLRGVMESHRVDTVYHAAAYKHVPLVENNLIEGARNNILGTWVVANSVYESGVEELVLISSDKAVRPNSVMGATKYLAEFIIQGFAQRTSLGGLPKRFCAVRFGNVLRSSGSVVPLFEKQIREGGPVSVTHPEATRYFMTSAEASELVVQAGAMANGGEVFLLDMGEPILIRDLAEKMIHLHGKSADPDDGPEAVTIEYIGLRPGEKLVEELTIDGDVETTNHPKIYRDADKNVTWESVNEMARSLEDNLENAEKNPGSYHLKTFIQNYSGLEQNPDSNNVVGVEGPHTLH